jgi:hypothetical protein
MGPSEDTVVALSRVMPKRRFCDSQLQVSPSLRLAFADGAPSRGRRPRAGFRSGASADAENPGVSPDGSLTPRAAS